MLDSSEITEDTIKSELDTFDIEDPDLLIRTCGEMRVSNFLLWQISYSEIYVTDVAWPDFNKEELIKACEAVRDSFGQVLGPVQPRQTCG